MTLSELQQIIASRKPLDPKNSYVASLFAEGEDRMIQKVGEEAVEVVIAAKNPNKERIISESADLMFHLLVLITSKDISLSDIEAELEARHKK